MSALSQHPRTVNNDVSILDTYVLLIWFVSPFPDDKAWAMDIFTGCDVTYYSAYHGTKFSYTTWLASLDITDSFVALSSPCTVPIPEEIMLKLEQFAVLMYCRIIDEMLVNTARMTLFSKMSRNIENISPT